MKQEPGTLTRPDGRKYIGEWANENLDGRGSLTYAHGTIDANLLFDSEGRTRTIYSLRHFYATQRLSSKTKPV